MKVRGKTQFTTPRKTVTLTRPVSGEALAIQVRALPVGVDQKMFDLFPDPAKPQDYAKDARGIILRDDSKRPILHDIETPEWAAANRENTNLRMAYIIYHGIDDPEVQFELTEKEGTPAFYKQVFAQLVEFGFTTGDLGRLMTEIMGLMNLGEDLETAKGN